MGGKTDTALQTKRIKRTKIVKLEHLDMYACGQIKKVEPT